MGWRLPAFSELRSLIDPNVMSNPQLPAGHPFIGLQTTGLYWTQTPGAFASTFFKLGFLNTAPVGEGPKDTQNFVWCVRGAPGPGSR